MSQQFRELLKKVGSGQHTHRDLTREEAAIATRMMLTAEATPVQIGAFLIAHRIKRPTGLELAGMLDAYDEFGQKLAPLAENCPIPLIFGAPYDGRSRTAPLFPLVALLLAALGQPVILHGGDTMPTKYGLALVDIWADLGLDFRSLSLSQTQTVLKDCNLTFYYTPRHFQGFTTLVDYREQIGKRPPLATLELIWSPYAGQSRLMAGYVHPPTEAMIGQALAAREVKDFSLIKGLEGSPDLRLGQTTIISRHLEGTQTYLKLDPYSHGVLGKDHPLGSREQYIHEVKQLLEAPEQAPESLRQGFLWNAGFYLWHSGLSADLSEAIAMAYHSLKQGKLADQYQQLLTRV